MGKIEQGILGGFKGKVGTVVGSGWKGIAVMKAKPISVANPKTAAQESQRGKFKSCSLLASLLLASIVKPLNDRFAQKMSGYNEFIKRNVENFNENGTLNANSIIQSKGKMQATSFTIMTQSQSTIEIEWSPALQDQYAKNDDVAYLSVVSKSMPYAKATATSGTAERSSGSMSIDLPTEWGTVQVGEEFIVTLSFLRADGTVVSNSSSMVATITNA